MMHLSFSLYLSPPISLPIKKETKVGNVGLINMESCLEMRIFRENIEDFLVMIHEEYCFAFHIVSTILSILIKIII